MLVRSMFRGSLSSLMRGYLVLACASAALAVGACGGDADANQAEGDASPAPRRDAATGTDAGGSDAKVAALSLAPLSPARIVRATSFDVPVVLAAPASGSDFVITVVGLPPEVTAAPLTMAAGSTKANLKLSATASAKLASRTSVTVRATAGGSVAETSLSVVIVDPPGTLDTTFDADGKVFADFAGNGSDIGMTMVRQANGSVIVGINDIPNNRVYLARYGENGEPDPTFGTAYVGEGGITSPAGLKQRADGSLILTYRTGTVGNPTGAKVVAFDANGKPNTQFGSLGELKLDASLLGANPSRTMLAAAPNGDIYGLAVYTGNNHIFRLTQDGKLDPTFGDNGKVSLGNYFEAYGWNIDAKGGFILAGSTGFPAYDRIAVRLLPDGQYDTSFSGDGRLTLSGASSESFDSPLVLSNGRVALGGTITEYGQVSAFLPNGDADTAFGAAGIASTKGTTPMRLGVYGEEIIAVGSSSMFYEEMRITRISTTTGAPNAKFGENGVLSITSAAKNVGNTFVIDDIGRITILGARSDASDFDTTLMRIWL